MNLYLAPFGIPWLLFLLVAVLLVTGASLRMARFLTHDALGEWLIVGPARRWARAREASKREAMSMLIKELEGSDNLQDAAVLVLARWSEKLRSDEPVTWQARLFAGAECPFCWAFWIGAALIALTVALGPLPVVGLIWFLILAALTLNYVVGHIVSRHG